MISKTRVQSVLLLVACAAFACGGGAAMLSIPPVPGADGGPAFQVTIGNTTSMIDSSKAFIKFDPTSKVLLIATWTPNLTPTCDSIAAPTKVGTEGSVTFVFASGAQGHATGEIPAYWARDQQVAANPTPPSEGPLQAKVSIKQFDDKVFKADLSSSDGTSLQGNVVGTVCPDGPIDAPVDPNSLPTASASDAGSDAASPDDSKNDSKAGKKKHGKKH